LNTCGPTKRLCVLVDDLAGRFGYEDGRYLSGRERVLSSTRSNLESGLCRARTPWHKLGRRAEAEAQLTNLQAQKGDSAAYQYAQVYAQWGSTAKALQWLDAAVRLHDSGLVALKTDPFLDPAAPGAAFPGDSAGIEVLKVEPPFLADRASSCRRRRFLIAGRIHRGRKG